MSICSYPELLNDPRFPEDVKQRARRILGDCKGGSVGMVQNNFDFCLLKIIFTFEGSYTDSAGLDVIKNDIADFITKRDNGVKANPSDIFLTAGGVFTNSL
jgi:alanine transaminase